MSSKPKPRKPLPYNKNIYTSRSQFNELDFETIFETINQLELCLIEDHRQDGNLSLVLAKQNERILDLKSSLKNEKLRNQRLIELILATDGRTEADEDESVKLTNSFVKEPFEFVSPLLMQQRYEDLSDSYSICRKQLIIREQELKILKCKNELLLTKYDHLLDKFREKEKCLQRTSNRNINLKKIINFKIHYLQDALNYATNCLMAAEEIIGLLCLEHKGLQPFKQQFQQNLQLFLNKLLINEWKYCNCYAIYKNK